MTEDRRTPRRPFDAALIREFLHGRDVVSAELFPSGNSNTNYKLVLADGTACVVRLHAAESAAREEYALGLVRSIVPVPQVLARGADWSIHSFLEGEQLAHCPEHTHAAAVALARISAIPFPSAGWIQDDGSVTPFDFGGGKSFVAAMLDRTDVQRWLGPATVTALRAIEAEQPRRQEPAAQPCLVHGDFNPTNILIRHGRVSGILDWEFTHAGGRYMDIGNLLRHTPAAYQDQIPSGLQAGGVTLPADWKRRAELVDLSSHLEFLTSQRADGFKKQCVSWIQAFIARYQTVR